MNPKTTTYRQGEWVKVLYESKQHVGVIINFNDTQPLHQVKCLIPREGEWWKLERDSDAVWYKECEVVGRCDNDARKSCHWDLYQL